MDKKALQKLLMVKGIKDLQKKMPLAGRNK